MTENRYRRCFGNVKQHPYSTEEDECSAQPTHVTSTRLRSVVIYRRVSHLACPSNGTLRILPPSWRVARKRIAIICAIASSLVHSTRGNARRVVSEERSRSDGGVNGGTHRQRRLGRRVARMRKDTCGVLDNSSVYLHAGGRAITDTFSDTS